MSVILASHPSRQLHPRPTACGTLTPIVVGDGSTTQTHTDRDHRVRVQFPWQRGSDAASRNGHPTGSNALKEVSVGDNIPARHALGVWLRGLFVHAAMAQVNDADTGIDFQWSDNNYVIFEGNTMYFGIYKRNCNENNYRTMTVPHRMQFIYRDGKLEENKGPRRGPAKPEIYIEPLGTDPCFNVNGVEECREELERDKAAKRAKQKRKATPAATTQ